MNILYQPPPFIKILDPPLVAIDLKLELYHPLKAELYHPAGILPPMIIVFLGYRVGVAPTNKANVISVY